MILMNGKVKSLMLISAFFLSFNVQAKLNGKNVVLVHGLQTTHLKGALDDVGLRMMRMNIGKNSGVVVLKRFFIGRQTTELLAGLKMICVFKLNALRPNVPA